MHPTRFVPLLVAALLATAVPAIAAAPPVALPGAVPAWAVPAHRVGPADPTAEVEVQLVLPWRDRAALRRLVVAVSDPASPAYGRHLDPAEFRARFAPTPGTVASVTAWLRSQGLRVGRVPANRLVVAARGSVAAAERALGTTLGHYAVSGLVLRAPDLPPRLPAAVARLVVGVRGLDEGSVLIRPGDPEGADPIPGVDEPPTPADTPPPNAIVYGSPCSAYDGERIARTAPRYGGRHQPYVTCATTPAQLRAAYGVPRGLDGAGRTIVVTGSHAVKRLPADLAEWSRRRRLPPLRAGQLRQISHPGAFQTPVSEPILRPTVWAVQTATLFEHVRAVAPAADLVFVGSTSSLDIPTATALAVDAKLGEVVVNGWYSLSENVPDAEVTLIMEIGEQAAATGISLLFASGDLGDGTRSGNPRPSVVWPANTPNVTSVGATSLLLGRGGAYRRELGWGKGTYLRDGNGWEDAGDPTYRGSGGGVSEVHDQPDYQRDVVPDSVARRDEPGPGRAVPDVSAAGDGETGLLVGYTMRFPDGSVRYAERRLATGTAATALFGAFVLLLNQKRGRPLGYLNHMLYRVYREHPTAFRDVQPARGAHGARVRIDHENGASGDTTQVLKPFEEFTSNVPRRGYDTVTGLGTPGPAFWTRVG